MKVCIIGASGKLGQYMIGQALERGYEVVGVCRPESLHKLNAFRGRIQMFTGRTNDGAVIRQAVRGCGGVLTVLAPWGVQQYASGTARAVLDHAEPGARLIFSCGWHITKDGKDVYPRSLRWMVGLIGWVGRATRLVDLRDQVAACDLIFRHRARWTVVRGSDLEEGPSQGLPIWRHHVGDPALSSNRTRRVDFGLFMVEALTNEALVHKAPAIVGCQSPSALAHHAI